MAVDAPPDFATTATLPPIPGLRFRHFAGPSDYPAMNDTANVARQANDVHFITPLDGFANFYEHLEHCDKARDLFIVEVDGSDLGKIGNGSTVTFGLSPGEHELRLRIDWTGSRRVSFRAEPGETVAFVCRAAVRLRSWSWRPCR